jgi:hypothetical protein
MRGGDREQTSRQGLKEVDELQDAASDNIGFGEEICSGHDLLW